MTISRHEAGAVVAGQKAGGQFAALSRTEADGGALAVLERPALPSDVVERLNDGYDESEDLASIRSFLNDHDEELGVDFELVYVDRDERLFGETIDTYLRGEQDDIYADELDDIYYDPRQDAATNRAQELAEELGLEWEELTQEAQDTFSNHIFENDTSDPLPQLVNNTPPQLMRAPIASNITAGMREWAEREFVDHEALTFGGHDDTEELRAKYLTDQLKRAGFNPDTMTAEDREEIMSLVTEGPDTWHEGVRLDVIWYGDIAEAALQNGGRSKTLTFGGAPMFSRENPEGKARVVLLDVENGSGYDVALSQPLTVTVDQKNYARLDSGGSSYGYGWDDTAGVYKPAYSVGVHATTPESQENTA